MFDPARRARLTKLSPVDAPETFDGVSALSSLAPRERSAEPQSTPPQRPPEPPPPKARPRWPKKKSGRSPLCRLRSSTHPTRYAAAPSTVRNGLLTVTYQLIDSDPYDNYDPEAPLQLLTLAATSNESSDMPARPTM